MSIASSVWKPCLAALRTSTFSSSLNSALATLRRFASGSDPTAGSKPRCNSCFCVRAIGQWIAFSVLPRNLLRYVAESLEASPLTIASLRTLYARRPTLYEHQQWAKNYLDLRDLDAAAEADLVAMLALHAPRLRTPTILSRPRAIGSMTTAS